MLLKAYYIFIAINSSKSFAKLVMTRQIKFKRPFSAKNVFKTNYYNFFRYIYRFIKLILIYSNHGVA